MRREQHNKQEFIIIIKALNNIKHIICMKQAIAWAFSIKLELGMVKCL
jgi:hypothetical protein